MRKYINSKLAATYSILFFSDVESRIVFLFGKTALPIVVGNMKKSNRNATNRRLKIG